MKEDVTLSFEERTLIARIRRDIDHHSAKGMREKIDQQLFELRPKLLIIDFSDVGFMDSSGLGLVLGRVEKATVLNTEVRICGLSPTLMKLVRLSGLDRIHNLTVGK